MLLSNRARRRLLVRLLFSLVMAMLPLTVGGAIVYWQTLASLQREARHAASEAERLVDVMLANAVGAARTTIAYSAGDCLSAEPILRQQVAIVPFVRSLNLTRDERIFCTSLYGPFDRPVDVPSYSEGRLLLMAGNEVTPTTSLLVNRMVDGRFGVLATIDGRYVTSVLQLVDLRSELQLQVGGRWMDEEGNVHLGPPEALPLGHASVPSDRFPFSVIGGFKAGEQWRYMREDSWPLLLGLSLLGVLSGISSYWLWGRAGTPTRELERALHAGEFVPYLQPLVDGASGRWVGAEVLMRWKHRSEGLVSPDLFIPMAERCGLIVPMTRSLLDQLAEGLAPHAGLLGQGFHLGVNISAEHCRGSGLTRDCADFLGAFAPDSLSLMLELTEREMIEASEGIRDLFEQLRALGVTLAIDDFGTGQSRLTYLGEFKLDALKIDKIFVASIGSDSLMRHILDSIVELSAKLDLLVIAEGIETPAQRDYLLGHGVECLQGYLFAKPMPLADFIAGLRAGRCEQAGEAPFGKGDA
ncbi:EAL domain-containing protein [Pseudomonas knackmussii]|uniref:EAL domain-containing protein n=1 Tax=Pseudomonas knackmussii TaxID=65741 RepID=UPI001362CE59|nr:EAL domain-containing protein [Pseudomonas knackmussii]